MNRADDMRLFYLMQDALEDKPISKENALYLERIRNEIRTLSKVYILANKESARNIADIIGKYVIIDILRNGRI